MALGCNQRTFCNAPLQNTRIQGAVSHLFEGHLQSLVECVNVEFKSAQKETYMDLSLDVKNCK